MWRIWPSSFRARLLRLAGLHIGEGVLVAAGVSVTGRDLRIGRDSFINEQCLLDGKGGLELGSNVYLAPRVMLLSTTHEPGISACRAGPLRRAATRVADGAWIGAGATVLPGVSVGAGGVIGAGAVVTSDTEADGLYTGIPARLKRSLGR